MNFYEPNILILLSTYNGQDYIKDQLNSLLNQKKVKVHLLVRDDGSTDNTIEILNNYTSSFESFHLIEGTNIGSKYSFLTLIQNAYKLSMNFEYYAFCDQDDYWNENKIFFAINKLDKLKSNSSKLYIGQTQLVDANLNFLKTDYLKIKLTFEESLMIYCATGCTMVFNNNLLKKIGNKTPSYFVMHDTWVYQVCLAIGGNVVFDNKPYILYRQHDKNVLGGKKNFFNTLKTRLKKIFVKKENERYNSAIALLNDFKKEILVKNKNTLINIKDYRISIRKRFSLIFNTQLVTSKLKNNISFRVAVLLGIY